MFLTSFGDGRVLRADPRYHLTDVGNTPAAPGTHGGAPTNFNHAAPSRRGTPCPLSSPERQVTSADSSSINSSPPERRLRGSWPPAETPANSPTSRRAGARRG